MLTGKKACMTSLHIFLTYDWLIHGQIDRNMNRSMVFLSIDLLIIIFREQHGLYLCSAICDY